MNLASSSIGVTKLLTSGPAWQVPLSRSVLQDFQSQPLATYKVGPSMTTSHLTRMHKPSRNRGPPSAQRHPVLRNSRSFSWSGRSGTSFGVARSFLCLQGAPDRRSPNLVEQCSLKWNAEVISPDRWLKAMGPKSRGRRRHRFQNQSSPGCDGGCPQPKPLDSMGKQTDLVNVCRQFANTQRSVRLADPAHLNVNRILFGQQRGARQISLHS